MQILDKKIDIYIRFPNGNGVSLTICPSANLRSITDKLNKL